MAEHAYQFGDWLIEPALNRARNGDLEVELEPITMNVLTFMLERPGETVSIDQFLSSVWKDRIVEPNAVHRNITMIRRALGDSAQNPRYVTNIRKRGYRTLAPVTPVDVCGANRRNPDHDAGLPTHDVERVGGLAVGKWLLLAVVAGLLVTLVAAFYLISASDVRSVAILPFEDMSPKGDQAYLGNGIADELRLELQRLEGLRVAGKTSSTAYAQADSKTIGEMLNVDSVVEGSIRKEGGNLRITAQLTRAADGFTIWSESYNRKLENIFELQEEIATSVAGALGVRLGVGNINDFRGAGTRNAEAYQLYLQTQTYDAGQVRADQMRLLERAVALDPNYAAAWSFLGHLTFATAWNAGPHQVAEIMDRAYPLVLRGVQLAPESATAHSNLAYLRHARFDWIGAEESFRRAMELRSDRKIVERYAAMVMRSGRTEYALSQFGTAYSLDSPGVRPPGQSWHARVVQGRLAEAKEISDWQPEAERIDNNLDMAFNEADPEKLKAAIRAIPRTSVDFTALYASVLADFDSPERVLSALRDIYRDTNLQWIRKHHDLAMVAAFFGDSQFALEVKSEEVRANVLRISSLWYPVMSEVRRLPEFKALVTELNLVKYWRAYGWADPCRPLGDEDFECS